MDRGPLLRKLKRSHPLSASGMRSIVSLPSLGYLAPAQRPSSKHQFRTVTGKGAGPASNHNVLLQCRRKTTKLTAVIAKVAIAASAEQRREGVPVSGFDDQLSGSAAVSPLSPCRSSCGSRTWSSFTWIYSASGATWPACREESCPTPSASWPSPLGPPSWRWAGWASSPCLPSTLW